MSRNRKDRADKLVDALWAYRTAFKTPLDMSPYRVVYGKHCHLPVKIEHRARWAIKMLNLDLIKAGEEWRLQLSKLEEIRAEVYVSIRSYKERAKLFQYKHIPRNAPGLKVLLYYSKLHLFPGKLRS